MVDDSVSSSLLGATVVKRHSLGFNPVVCSFFAMSVPTAF